MNRRAMLAAALAAALGGLFSPAVKPASAAEKATLIAKEVDQVPEDPEDGLWAKADLLEVPLAPQAVVKPRTYENGVKSIRVRALYDGERLALLLEWRAGSRGAGIGSADSFQDAVAVAFPSDPAKRTPYFGMGEPNNPVTIYQWKAGWQFGSDYDVDEHFPNMAVDWYPFTGRGPREIAQASDYGREGAEKVFLTSWWAGSTLADPALQARTSVEKLTAEGFGTLASVEMEKQDGLGQGVWKDGVWTTLLSIPRAQERFSFSRGRTIPIAFAAWDGSRRERGGEKGISTWYFLSLEQPVGPFALVSPILVVAGAAIAQIVGLRWLRRRAQGSSERVGGP